MESPANDKRFTGSIPRAYQDLMVPMIFEPFALDLAERLVSRSPSSLLEIAAGTGAVTRRLAASLREDVQIVATDLHQPMLDVATAIGTERPVEWRQADALDLPFPDESFDAVVCQFGVMFFPDKPKAYSEVLRVLRPGGVFLFNVWDHISENELPDTANRAIASLFPDAAKRFAERTPHGYFDRPTIESDLAQGGFENKPSFEVVTRRSRAASPRLAALALSQGTPMRNEIEAIDLARLDEATDRAEDAIVQRFGSGPVDAKMQAIVVVVEKG